MVEWDQRDNVPQAASPCGIDGLRCGNVGRDLLYRLSVHIGHDGDHRGFTDTLCVHLWTDPADIQARRQ